MLKIRKFILRIDDTDQEVKDEYISQIKYDLEWLGIDYTRLLISLLDLKDIRAIRKIKI